MAQPGSGMKLARRGVALHVPFAARACWRWLGGCQKYRYIYIYRRALEPVVNPARLVLCGSQADDYSPRQPGCVCCARYHVRRAMAVWNPAWAKNI